MRDIHSPHLVRPLDRHAAQKIRVNLVSWRGLGRVRPAIQRLNAHAPHHRPHHLPADDNTLAAQQIPQHPATREWVIQMQGIDPSHDRKLGRRHRPWFIVEAAPAEPQQFRLLHQRKVMAPVDHRFALGRPALLSALDKKSFSSVSSPILA